MPLDRHRPPRPFLRWLHEVQPVERLEQGLSRAHRSRWDRTEL